MRLAYPARILTFNETHRGIKMFKGRIKKEMEIRTRQDDYVTTRGPSESAISENRENRSPN